MKVLVLGASGMLGHKMLQTLAARFGDACGSVRGNRRGTPFDESGCMRNFPLLEHVDAMDLAALCESVRAFRPDVVVNCIGIVKQRAAAHDSIPSLTINSLLPHRLAVACAEWRGRLIHFSTDCVFSGQRGQYTEDDTSDAQDLYGRTKFLGEVESPNALTLRTSMIGREIEHFHSLLEWFLAQRGGRVRGFVRAIYSGVTTNHLAALVADIIEHHPDIAGLYQVAGVPISKYDLLCLARDAFEIKMDIVPDESVACDRSMLGDRLYARIGYRAPPWPDLMAEVARDRTSNERPQ